MHTKLQADVVRVLALVFAFSAQTVFAQPDPADPGPLAGTVQRIEYNFGDTAFTPSAWPPQSPGVEVNAVVYYPDLSQGPYPLVVFMHGRHVTCFQNPDLAFLEWPCAAGHSPIPSYQGYEYIQQILAGWGYIVVSIGVNGINAFDNTTFDLGAQGRGELINHHLDRWNTWNTVGAPPFGDTFVGKVNLNNVGTMGHSRGGEGVARHFVYNQGIGAPYGINAVLPLAPVDFNRDDVKNVPLEVLLSYCDGDVSDLQGIHFVDDVRYAAGDSTPKHATLVMGGNHNYYNTQWTPGIGPPGAADDWTAFVSGGPNDVWCGTVAGNHRLTPAQQRGVGTAYVIGFFRRYLGGESAFSPLWKGDAPPPPSAMTTEIHQSYLPGEAARLDVNRYSTPAELTVNTLGGAVTPNALATYLRCGVDFHCLQTPPASTAQQPHTTPSARSSRRGLSQARLAWNDVTAFLENDIPAGSGDVSGLSRLQFRASINIQDSRNTPGAAQDFSVTLTDGAGNSATTQVSTVSDVLFYPPGSVIPVPKVFLNTVRIPLACFPGVDLTNVQSVVFNFDRRTTGGLLLSDLQFAD